MERPCAAALAACTLLVSCHGAEPRDAASAPAGVVTQQAGGDTAWLWTGVDGASGAAVTGAAAGRAIAAIARQPDVDAPIATSLLAVDPSGALAWSDTLEPPGCNVVVAPLGATAAAHVALLVRSDCGGPVAGLGPEPIAQGGAIVVMDGGGRFLARVSLGTELATSPIIGAALGAGGDILLLAAAPTPVVVSIAEDGAERWRRELPGARALAPAAGGGAVIATAAEPVQLVLLGDDGASLWRRDLPEGFELLRVTPLTDGAVAASGVLASAASWGRGNASAGASILVVEPGGMPRTIAGIADAAPDAAPRVVTALPHGRILLSGFPECDRLRALSPQLETVWDRGIDTGCDASAFGATVTGAGQVVVAGEFAGRGDFGSGYIAQASAPSAFLLGLWP